MLEEPFAKSTQRPFVHSCTDAKFHASSAKQASVNGCVGERVRICILTTLNNILRHCVATRRQLTCVRVQSKEGRIQCEKGFCDWVRGGQGENRVFDREENGAPRGTAVTARCSSTSQQFHELRRRFMNRICSSSSFLAGNTFHGNEPVPLLQVSKPP